MNQGATVASSARVGCKAAPDTAIYCQHWSSASFIISKYVNKDTPSISLPGNDL